MKKLFLSVYVICLLNSASAQWTSNGPTGATVTCLTVNGSNIFAGTDGGVFISTNTGGSWTAVNNGLTYTGIFSITSSDTSIFAGTNGAVYLSTNNGGLWTAVDNGLSATSLVFTSLAANGPNVFAGIEGDGVYASANNGALWASANTGLSTIFMTSLITVGSTLYGASNYGGIYISSNNAAGWTNPACAGLNGADLNAIAVSGSGIFVGTAGNGIYLSTDAGATFTAVNTGIPASENVYSLAVSGSNIFAGTQLGGCYLSTNNGASWTSIGAGLPADNYISSLAIIGSTIFAGTDGHGVWQRTLSELGCSLAEPQLITTASAFCPNDSVQVCSPSFTSYKWNTGDTVQCLEAKQAGNYYVTVTDNNGCTAVSDTIALSLYPVPADTISATRNILCTGDSTSICSLSAFTTYQWNVPGTGSCISTKQAGNYYLTVTNNNGCSASSNTITISADVFSVDTLSSATNIFCANDSLQICAPANFTAYQWNPEASGTGNCIYATQAGDYYVTVTDHNGCTAQSNQLSVSVYPVPSVSITVQGDTLSSFGQVSYQWILNNISLSGDTSPVYVAGQPGSYTVQVTDTNGCTSVSQPVVVTGLAGLPADEWFVNVFPNPFSVASVQLALSSELVGGALELFDEEGRLVFKSEIRHPKSEIILDVAKGVYYLRISNANVSVVRKLVKM